MAKPPESYGSGGFAYSGHAFGCGPATVANVSCQRCAACVGASVVVDSTDDPDKKMAPGETGAIFYVCCGGA